MRPSLKADPSHFGRPFGSVLLAGRSMLYIKRSALGSWGTLLVVNVVFLAIGLMARPHMTQDWLAAKEELRLHQQPLAPAEADVSNGWEELMAAWVRFEAVEDAFNAEWAAEPIYDGRRLVDAGRLARPNADTSMDPRLADRRRALLAAIDEAGIASMVRRAASRPRLSLSYRDADPSPALLLLLDAKLSETIQLTNILVIDGEDALVEGDIERTLQSAEALLRMGDALRRQVTMLEHEVGRFAERRGLGLARRAAETPDFPDAAVRDLAGLLARYHEAPPAGTALAGEMLVIRQIYDATHTSWGMFIPSEISKHAAISGQTVPWADSPKIFDAAGLFFLSKRDGLGVIEESVRRYSEAPYITDRSERSRMLRSIERLHTPRSHTISRYALANVLLPAVFPFCQAEYSQARVYDITRLAVAAALFEREAGDPPARSADLAPGYLDVVPIDITTGEPLTLDVLAPAGPGGEQEEDRTDDGDDSDE
jgi:hypothetical protein